ncbi:MAG: riboflavin biosynthesis protein RibF [Clostridiales bacterium]|nr:riboflavin biosynthesis protein RibF [Clostridiales bacterium]
MIVLTDEKEIAAYASSRRLYLALGYFDGVHLGHQALFRRVLAMAEASKGQPGVLLLEPHPQKVLHQSNGLRILTPLEEKIRLIQAYGDMDIFLLRFDAHFAALTPEAFVKACLLDLFHIQGAVCGYNYRFGSRGSGSSATLTELAERYGFSCIVQDRVTAEGKPLSSTDIRCLIEAGRMVEAYKRLGHCCVFSGGVISGNRLGARIGFPTANLELDPDIIWPAYGVYGAFIRDETGRIHRGIVNVGVRPTVESETAAPSFEAHILRYEGDLYGKKLRVVLSRKIRDERLFSDIDALRAQITADLESADTALSEWERFIREKEQSLESIFACFIKDYPL